MALADKEAFWKQRSWIKWLKDGDRNTKFFHDTTLEKRSRLYISRIKNDMGIWLERQEEIQDEAVWFFQTLLSEESVLQADSSLWFLLQHIPSLVSNEDNAQLTAEVKLEEVRNAIFGLDPESAPGMDGYPGDFYRHCWEIISLDLLITVR